MSHMLCFRDLDKDRQDHFNMKARHSSLKAYVAIITLVFPPSSTYSTLLSEQVSSLQVRKGHSLNYILAEQRGGALLGRPRACPRQRRAKSGPAHSCARTNPRTVSGSPRASSECSRDSPPSLPRRRDPRLTLAGSSAAWKLGSSLYSFVIVMFAAPSG